jgi:1,4-alpha-glucan branching enzyme
MTQITAGGLVEFRFFRPGAATVSVAGSFNQWSQSAHQMTRAGDGWWTAKVALPAGEYRFRYVADQTWFTDFAAYGVEPTTVGANSILVVSKQIAAKRVVPEFKAEMPVEQVAEIQREKILQKQSVN